MSEQRPSFSLRNKLVVYILGFSILVGVIRIASDVYGIYQKDRDYLNQKLNLITQKEIDKVASISDLNVESLVSVTETLLEQTEVHKAMVYDSNFKKISEIEGSAQLNENTLSISSFDVSSKEKIGEIRLEISYQYIRETIFKSMPNLIIAEFLKIFFVLVFLYFIINGLVLSPLHEILEFLNNRKENSFQREEFTFSHERNDELQVMANSLNDLLNENSRNVMKIEQANELLEMQVKARTEQYKTALETSKKLSNEKTHYFANISHDLRTPLNSIILLSKLLSRNSTQNLTDDQVEQLRVINESGNSLINIINDLIDISKYEAGNIKAVISKFNSEKMADLLGEVYSDEESNVTINQTSNVFISSDFDKIIKVIRVVIDFTITYNSKIEINFNNPDNKSLKVEIKIDGGIDTNFNEFKEFLSFKEITNLLRLNQINSIIARYYLEFLKADYNLKSSDNQMLLSMSFPDLEESTLVYNYQKDAMDIMTAKSTEADQGINEIKIALLDDEEDSVFTLQSLLESDGASVQAHTNPILFLEAIPSNIPDIAIVDQRMPEKTGLEVVKEMRDVLKIDIPIIILSGDYLDDDPAMKKLKDVHFMLKPIDYYRLTREITNLKV